VNTLLSAGANAALPTFGPDWLDAELLVNDLLERFGVWALAAICVVVIIETGLLFPLLPGDSLLFTVGLFTGTGQMTLPIWVVCLSLFLAAFGGDQLGYFIGHKAGPAIFRRPDSRWFKREHVDKTHAFFDKYGGRAIILARFVPFLRTYVPVAAGVGQMSYIRFAKFNVIGAFLWGVGVTLLGFWLGNFAAVRDNLEVAILLIVFVSLLPVMVETIKHRMEARRSPVAGNVRQIDQGD
jgi:membrane-associated protein